MADLPEEEYDALDEYYTQNPPKMDPAKNGTGFFSRHKAAARTITVDGSPPHYSFRSSCLLFVSVLK